MVSHLLYYARFMLKPDRLSHVLNVRDFALLMAHRYGVDPRRVEVAALAHDLFRDVPPEKLLKLARLWDLDIDDVEGRHPVLLHGKVAAEFLRRRFSFHDRSVLLAISYHTSAHPDMDEIGKILVVADTVGYDRNYEGVEELRNVALRDLDEAFLKVLENRITYALRSRRFLLPMSVATWNKLVSEVIG